MSITQRKHEELNSLLSNLRAQRKELTRRIDIIKEEIKLIENNRHGIL